MPSKSSEEAWRLQILAEYGVMDTGPDEALNEIVELAAAICETPVALISLVDDTRQWFKAKTGLGATETPRDLAFCAHAIEADDAVFSVRDARVDARFAENPLVTGDPNVVFYAGAPLTVAEGVNLGTLCVIDRKPRDLTAAQKDALEKLSKVVCRYLERRKSALLQEGAEAFSQTVLRSIGDAVIATDRKACVTYLNPIAEQLTGFSLAEAVGKPMTEVFRIINEHTREVVPSPVERVLVEQVVAGLANHTLLIRKDGVEIPIEESAAPVRVGEGAVTGVVLVFRDATTARVERRKLLDTFMQAPVAIAVLEGPAHTFTFANPLYRALVNNRDVVGKTLADALPDLRDHGFDALLDRVKQSGTAIQVREAELKLDHHREDERLILDFTYAPLDFGSGKSDAVIATLIDVTAQVEARRSETQARRRSDLLFAVAAALAKTLERGTILRELLAVIVPELADFASVWSVDDDKRVRREAFAPYDESLEVATASAAPQIFPHSFPIQRVVESCETLVLNELPASLESLPEHAEVARQLRLDHAIYAPIFRGAVVIGVLAVARRERAFTVEDELLFASIATQVGPTLGNARLHAEVVRLRDAAESATTAKDEFLARVSHDLRNPLGAILGWATLLKSGTAAPAKVARGIEVIERSANAQVQLIEDLLDVSRIAEGKMRLEPALEPVAPAIEAALEPAHMAASNKGVRLEVSIDAEVGSIVVDPDRFRQVIWNLASNAVKFTPAGGQVRVHAMRTASSLEIRVADTGKGIPRAFLTRIFGSFEQAGEGSTRSAGLGLGLAIVRHIVELHGGTVTAASDGEGKGSTFTVLLPIPTSAWTPDRPSSVRAGPPSSKKLALVKVLAVDDEGEARDV